MVTGLSFSQVPGLQQIALVGWQIGALESGVEVIETSGV